MIDSPGLIIALLVAIILELGYIIINSLGTSHHFRDYIDAVVLLAFICSVYFIFKYLKNQSTKPARVNPLQQPSKQASLTFQKQEIEKLTKSQEFQSFQRQRQKVSSHSEHRLSKDDEFFLNLVAENETAIFGEQ